MQSDRLADLAEDDADKFCIVMAFAVVGHALKPQCKAEVNVMDGSGFGWWLKRSEGVMERST